MANLKVSFDSSYVKTNGEQSLYVVTKIQGVKLKFHTQVSVKDELFDPERGIVLSDHPKAFDYNLMIEAVKNRLHEIFVRYRLQHINLTPDMLKKEYYNYNSRIDFHTFLEEAIRERKGEITYSTIKQHRAMAAKLKKFSPTLKFAQLDVDFMARFNRWMINSEKNEQNTRFNTFKNLKAYLNIAQRKRIITYNPLTEWMPVKQTETRKEFLTEDEVRDLVDLYDSKALTKNTQKTLRHFLFMCFTGLRISDLMSVEVDAVIGGMLVYNAQKTSHVKKNMIRVPLTPVARRLIRDEIPYRKSGLLFDTLSEQQMRIKVKEIARVAGIHKDISLHTARHTFATMFLRNSKNIAVLQRLLGHSKIEQTMIYAHVLTEDIEREVQYAFSKFQ